jgi:hypothetical protein
MVKRNKWSDSDIEVLRENYHKGIKFVKKLLPNRTFNSIKKKAQYFNLKSDKINFDLQEIIDIINESYSFADVFRKLNKSKSGDAYNSLRRFIIRSSIDISHFRPWQNNGKFKIKKDINNYLITGSTIPSSRLKDKLYEDGIKKRICEKCGQGEEWNGERMSLILDHINGIPNDNRLENLRILCPNCNSTLPTHCRGSRGIKSFDFVVEEKIIIKKEIFTDSEKRSQLNQRKVQRPSYTQLSLEVNEIGYVATGKKYGVSDNTIRKWIKMYQKHGENF